MLMVRAIERGLSLNDFESMTVGMVIGYITTYNNIFNANSEEKGNDNVTYVRKATQEDWDRFSSL